MSTGIIITVYLMKLIIQLTKRNLKNRNKKGVIPNHINACLANENYREKNKILIFICKSERERLRHTHVVVPNPHYHALGWPIKNL